MGRGHPCSHSILLRFGAATGVTFDSDKMVCHIALFEIASSAGTKALFWILFSLTMVLRSLCALLCFTSVFIMISNSAPPSAMGTVNGIGQSMSSLARGLGPPSMGAILAWGLGNGLPTPMNFHFPFVVMALVQVCV